MVIGISICLQCLPSTLFFPLSFFFLFLFLAFFFLFRSFVVLFVFTFLYARAYSEQGPPVGGFSVYTGYGYRYFLYASNPSFHSLFCSFSFFFSLSLSCFLFPVSLFRNLFCFHLFIRACVLRVESVDFLFCVFCLERSRWIFCFLFSVFVFFGPPPSPLPSLRVRKSALASLAYSLYALVMIFPVFPRLS